MSDLGDPIPASDRERVELLIDTMSDTWDQMWTSVAERRTSGALTVADVARLAWAAQQVAAAARTLAEEATRIVADRVPAGRATVVDGCPPFTVRWGRPRVRWDRDRLTSTLLRIVGDRVVSSSVVRRLADPETGEAVDAIPVDHAGEVVREAWELCPPSGSSVRVTRLRDAGVDPDELCETGDPRPSIVWAD